ncbi:aminotransferase class I/II-fold pyridoxal phosphate-dependent enzyme, partial [Mycobacterium tuberculosis]|nr:aminotransferase class I/II-fold pyridoxal phosphate-dependent enzyme [Mycobacterium tuberculosis]
MVTTSGVSSAIETIARAMCQPGDYVLVDDPTWFWIIGCLQQLGLTVIGVNRNSHGVDIAQLQQILENYRPKLYITNSVL